MHKFLLVLALAASGLGFAPRAHAVECTEFTSPNTNIVAGGHYCLANNLAVNSTSGAVVSLNADDIELDCHGYSITNASTNPAGKAYGIYINNRRHVRVHDCHVSGGFAAGIYAYQDNGLANQNSDIEIRDNSVSGAYWYGILAYGTGITIRGNRIHDIGGRASFAMGIRIGGSLVSGEPRFFVVDGNVVSGVDSPGNNAYAIYGNNPDGSVITNNAIYGTLVHNGSYDGYGVYLFASASSRNRITGNTITGTSFGPDFGVYGAASDSCFDNLIRNVSTQTGTCDATHGNF